MNLCIFTCRIISRPQLTLYKKHALVQMTVSLCNNKKGIDYYNVIAIAKNKMGGQIFDIYRKGDFVVIEGSVKIKLKRIYSINKKLNIRKIVTIKINKVHPTNHAFKFYF